MKQMPMCPYCDSGLDPEPIGEGLWLCVCCSKVFKQPTLKKS
jgi:ribosomal protein L37AE/L43A